MSSMTKWQEELENSIRTIEDIEKYTYVAPEVKKSLDKVIKKHPMKITPYYLSLIDWDNPQDPIKRMVLPDRAELNPTGSFDTSGEAENTKFPGLQHKYKQTALILSTNRCASYCRHCFRKRLVGLENSEIISRFDDAASYIAEHKEINNVLISGGDPLVLPNHIIASFLDALEGIDHIKFIRFGSRTPAVLPSRYDDVELIKIFKKFSRPDRRLYIITHFNYPKELTSKSLAAIDKIISSGVIMSNQTVLLRGINDYPRTLANLQNKLAAVGVTPYYVFQSRPTKRAKHFQIPIVEGILITEEAKKHCSGISKRFKYIMSHKSGKIEILGKDKEFIYFKLHQAVNEDRLGRIFKRRLNRNACWLDDFRRN